VFQERKFLQFTPHGIIIIPRKIRPLRNIEQSYREPRDTDHTPSEPIPPNTNEPLDAHDLPMCDRPDCTLPQHSDDVPHSYETRPTGDLGPNPPRYPNRPPPNNNVEFAMRLDDVSNDLLAIRHDDTLSDILTPSTYEDAIKSRHASRWR